MSSTTLFLLLFIIGAIPSGPIVCYALSLKAPSEYGSKNTGATNVARQSQLAGVLTLAFDLLKGVIPLSLLGLGSYWMIVPVLGHCYSPFLRFKGGKGVATGLGGLLVCAPNVAALSIVTWVTSIYLSKNAGLSSVITCGGLIAYSLVTGAASILICASIILARHKDNLIQLRLISA